MYKYMTGLEYKRIFAEKVLVKRAPACFDWPEPSQIAVSKRAEYVRSRIDEAKFEVITIDWNTSMRQIQSSGAADQKKIYENPTPTAASSQGLLHDPAYRVICCCRRKPSVC